MTHAFLLLTPSLLAMAWLVSRAQWFWVNREELNFGFGMPVFCLFALIQALGTKPAVQLRWSWPATALTLGGAATVFVAQVLYTSFGSLASNLAFLALGLIALSIANVIHVFGWPSALRFLPVYAFMLLALPLPSGLQGPVVNGLQNFVTTLDVAVLNLIGIPAQQTGSVIQLPNGAVGVNEACSGIRSLHSTIMLSFAFGYLKLRHLGLKAVLLGLGVFWAVFGNFCRSLFLSWVANSSGSGGVDKYHDPAGWSVLAFTLLALMASVWLLNRLENAALRKDSAGEQSAPPESAAASQNSSPNTSSTPAR